MNLKEVHPVLPVKNVKEALDFYTQQLGFSLFFSDSDVSPEYAGVRREGVEIHLQWHDAAEWVEGIDRPQIRILCDTPDLLYEEYSHLVRNDGPGIRNTPWETREFGVYDPDGNALIFYRNL